MLKSLFGIDTNGLDLALTSLTTGPPAGLGPRSGFQPPLQTQGSQVTVAGSEQAAPREVVRGIKK